MSLALPHWLWLATALLLFAFSIGLSAYTLVRRTPPKVASKLAIHSANYRTWDGTGESFDVTDFLRGIITGDSLVLGSIENHSFVLNGKNFVPRDPQIGKEKRLEVVWSYDGGQRKTARRKEHGRLTLPEDSVVEWLGSERERLAAENTQLQQTIKQNDVEFYRARPIRDDANAELRTVKTRLQGPAMFEKRVVDTDPQKEAECLSDEIRQFAREIGPRPERKPSSKANTETEEVEALREYNLVLFPWLQRLQGGWLGRFDDRVKKVRHLLAERGINDVDLNMAVMGDALDEKRFIRIADRLLIASRAEIQRVKDEAG